MKNKLITTLFGLSLLIVPAARAERTTWDRLNMSGLLALGGIAAGGFGFLGYKAYKWGSNVLENANKVPGLETELVTTKGRVTTLEKGYTTLSAQYTKLDARVKTTETELKTTKENVATLKRDVTQLRTAHNRAQQDVTDLKKRVSALEANAAQQNSNKRVVMSRGRVMDNSVSTGLSVLVQ